MPPATQSAFATLGGEAGVRPLIARLVQRMFADPMIGFFFAGVTKRRIEALEYSHAAEHLGSGEAYRGRPLGRAHAKHRIGGGHFGRRLQILREVLQEAGVPADIAEHWLSEQEGQRAAIVGSRATSPCPQS